MKTGVLLLNLCLTTSSQHLMKQFLPPLVVSLTPTDMADVTQHIAMPKDKDTQGCLYTILEHPFWPAFHSQDIAHSKLLIRVQVGLKAKCIPLNHFMLHHRERPCNFKSYKFLIIANYVTEYEICQHGQETKIIE